MLCSRVLNNRSLTPLISKLLELKTICAAGHSKRRCSVAHTGNNILQLDLHCAESRCAILLVKIELQSVLVSHMAMNLKFQMPENLWKFIHGIH